MSSGKQKVALVSLAASSVLASAKLGAGIVTGSIGLISEAIHSGLDFVATFITWLAVRFADKPPDETHHFGHAKAEALSALLTTALLMVTVVWIVWEAATRLFGEHAAPQVPWWAIALVIASIFIDFNRARALRRAAEEHGSQALAADALHFSSDMLSSGAVLAGLVAVWLGYPRADALAALAVAGFIVHAGWQLGSRTIATLLDAAPEGMTDRVREAGRQTPGVLDVRRVRISPKGQGHYVDVDFTVRRTLGIDQVDRIKQALTQRICEAVPGADVSPTALPVALDDETVQDKVYLLALRRGLAVHHLTIQRLDEQLSVSFDLEVDADMHLGRAHAIATELENAIAGELGEDVEVESHIEPLMIHHLEGADADSDTAGKVERTLRRLAARVPVLFDVHNVRTRETGHGLFVTLHCRAAPDTSVETVHEAVETLESGLRKAVPAVRRVIAHAEPPRPA